MRRTFAGERHSRTNAATKTSQHLKGNLNPDTPKLLLCGNFRHTRTSRTWAPERLERGVCEIPEMRGQSSTSADGAARRNRGDRRIGRSVPTVCSARTAVPAPTEQIRNASEAWLTNAAAVRALEALIPHR